MNPAIDEARPHRARQSRCILRLSTPAKCATLTRKPALDDVQRETAVIQARLAVAHQVGARCTRRRQPKKLRLYAALTLSTTKSGSGGSWEQRNDAREADHKAGHNIRCRTKHKQRHAKASRGTQNRPKTIKTSTRVYFAQTKCT